MKRFPIFGMLLLAPALAMLAMVGCGGGGGLDKGHKTTTADGKTTPGGDSGGKTEATKKVDITTALDATVKGVVKLKGDAPEPKEEPLMAKHGDAKFCLTAPKKFLVNQVWMVGKDKELANVVVSLAPPAGKKFKLDDDLKKKSKKTATIDQPFCNYDPHVVAVWPEVQGVVFLNSAPVPHNVKIAFAKLSNPDINMKPKPNDGPSTKSDELFFKGGGSETVVDASCSMHTWMNAKIAVFAHPYIAVTKADGSFEIPNVPVDEELTVYLWHESHPTKVEVMKHKMTKGVNDLKVLEYSGK